MYKLVIADDEGKNTVVPLVRDEITIGRKEGNTIRLTERNVSRRHARLVKANGKFVIEDLHSYNGVRVNGQRIGAETSLEAGDQIQIGDYQLALQVDQTDATTVPEATAPLTADAATAMIAAPGPPARLVMITPPAPGAEFVLTQEKVRLGRAEDLDIWVNHRSISREHAEIQKEPDGGLRLIDLGSANGVRVNGNDVQNALLQPGDVVELGQVRFRFVGAGEHYAFDADRTVQMDAVSLDRGPKTSKAPLFIAIGMIGVAIVGAIGIALFWNGDDDEPTVTPLDSNGNVTGPTTAPTQDFAQSLQSCRAAITSLTPAEGIVAANAALAARPGDAEATACRDQATALAEQAQTLAQAIQFMRDGNAQQAYFTCASLPDDSPYRARPECAQAAQAWAAAQLEAGSQMLRVNPAESRRIAEDVLLIPGITSTQRSFAQSLVRAAEDAGAAAEPIATGGDQRRPPRGGNTPRPPRGGQQERGGQQQAGAQQQQQQQQQQQPEERPAGNAEAEARQCTMRGDNACVIRLLAGNARSEAAMGMLIEAYRARGQTNDALRLMRNYVERFPGTSRTRNYQQILARHP